MPLLITLAIHLGMFNVSALIKSVSTLRWSHLFNVFSVPNLGPPHCFPGSLQQLPLFNLVCFRYVIYSAARGIFGNVNSSHVPSLLKIHLPVVLHWLLRTSKFSKWSSAVWALLSHKHSRQFWARVCSKINLIVVLRDRWSFSAKCLCSCLWSPGCPVLL